MSDNDEDTQTNHSGAHGPDTEQARRPPPTPGRARGRHGDPEPGPLNTRELRFESSLRDPKLNTLTNPGALQCLLSVLWHPRPDEEGTEDETSEVRSCTAKSADECRFGEAICKGQRITECKAAECGPDGHH